MAGRFSSDGGRSWTVADTVVLSNERRYNVMSVSLLRLKDGRLMMFCRTESGCQYVSYSNGGEDRAGSE